MARKIKVDLTGVETFQRASEGEHVVKIASADMKQSQGGNDMITVAYEVTRGEDKGSRVYENYPLVETALWKLKGMLQALGMKADGKVQLDLDKMVGKTCKINVIHEEYEGKLRARVESVMKLTANTDEDADDEDEDFDEDQEDQEEEEEKPVKSKAASKKAPINPPEDEEEDEDDDWDEDEDEEEEEKPAPKKKAAPPKAKKKPKPEEDDDDDDWDEE